MRHTRSEELITMDSAEWVLLSVIYHYVFAQSPSPESAKIAISEARKNGQLRLRAEVREHEARPQLKPGEPVPEMEPRIRPNQTILPSDKFSWWDWERSHAIKRDESTKSMFEYMNIVGSRDDVLRLWPSSEMQPEAAKTAIAKPVGVSRLVWAVVLTLDDIERQNPGEFAALTQKHLAQQVNARLSRDVSRRTLQKAVAVRRKRHDRPSADLHSPTS
jgi:hypothetical protein